jgi:hypothetical protein
MFQGGHRPADQYHLFVGVDGLGAAKTDRQARKLWRLRIFRIERHRRFVDEILDPETGDRVRRRR